MAEQNFAERVAADGARSISIFVNCPFDEEFLPLRDAIAFSIVCSGFIPRVAMDIGSVSVPRMVRIMDALEACRYSIHDLTRCTGEGELNLARFNMPLELGIAMAHQHAASSMEHDWLAMVPSEHPYATFASDLAGYDLRTHSATPDSVVRTTLAWLWTLDESVRNRQPDEVLELLPRFIAAREQLDIQFGGNPPWESIFQEALRTLGA